MSPLSFFSPSSPTDSFFFRNKTVAFYAGGSLIVFLLFKLLDTGFISSMIDTFFSFFPFILILGVCLLSYFKYNAYKKAAMNLPHIETFERRCAFKPSKRSPPSW